MEGRDLDLASITGFLAEEGVAKFKWPEAVRVMEALPIGPTGKVDRVGLRQALGTAG